MFDNLNNSGPGCGTMLIVVIVFFVLAMMQEPGYTIQKIDSSTPPPANPCVLF